MWEKISVAIALVSLLVSAIAVINSRTAAQSSLDVANEALSTARQTNDIALGRVREPAVVEFAARQGDEFEFDFTNDVLTAEELEYCIMVRNSGKVSVDVISFEAVGITPFTYLMTDPDEPIRPLPSISLRVNLRSALQPGALANIDYRKIVLKYLEKLEPRLQDKDSIYNTVINLVMDPKAVNHTVPFGAPGTLTKDDRRMLIVKFKPSVVYGEKAKIILDESEIPNRVYSPHQ